MGKARAGAKKMAKGSLEPSGARPVSHAEVHAEVGVPHAEVGARDEPTNVFGGGPDDFTTPVGLAYGALVVAIFLARIGVQFLLEHYVASNTQPPSDGFDGAIQARCSPVALVRRARPTHTRPRAITHNTYTSLSARPHPARRTSPGF